MASEGGDPKFADEGISEAREMLSSFWDNVSQDIESTTSDTFKKQELPLARIKKIMKLDEDVKMISQEAPILFAKAAEIFISEISLRGWLHTEENKRKTLQKSDISMAVSKYDQFDFLIDIVPREEPVPKKEEGVSGGRTASMLPEQVQYYFQLAQSQQNQQSGAQTVQVQGQPTVVQLGGGGAVLQTLGGGGDAAQPQIIQLQQPAAAASTSSGITGATPSAGAATSQPAAGVQVLQQQPLQIMQQVIGSNGEVTSVPVQLSAAQMQAIQVQLQGARVQQGQVVVQGAQTAQAVTLDTSALTSNGQQVQTIYVQQPSAAAQSGQTES